jgi:hypothetical protein
MNKILIGAIACMSAVITCQPLPLTYAEEIAQYRQALPADYTCYPTTAAEKMFQDIFSMATLPYTQPITLIKPEQCASLNTLIQNLSEQYNIEAPLLFLANDATTAHIDIKLCVFNTSSALLIHPTTVTALTPRVLDRYIEQAFMRITSTIHAYKKYISQQKKKGIIYATVSGALLAAAGALLTYFNKTEQYRWINPAVASAVAVGYGALLYHLFKTKQAGFSFQRLSSFHNTEQAREDRFPLLDANQQPVFTRNPSESFGLNAIIETQKYLRSRNAQFCEFEKLDTEKNEEPSSEDSYYQKLDLLRQKITPTQSKKKKSVKSTK